MADCRRLSRDVAAMRAAEYRRGTPPEVCKVLAVDVLDTLDCTTVARARIERDDERMRSRRDT